MSMLSTFSLHFFIVLLIKTKKRRSWPFLGWASDWVGVVPVELHCGTVSGAQFGSRFLRMCNYNIANERRADVSKTVSLHKRPTLTLNSVKMVHFRFNDIQR